jgi:hypothetical protein
VTAYDIAAKLPALDILRSRCQALAVLERVVGSLWPYYSYTCDWGDDEAALMTNGSGDEWAIVFTANGCFIRVFDHESEMTPYRDDDHELWPGLLDGLPDVFRPQLRELAFADAEGRFIATAVLWRLHGDDRWHAGAGIIFPPLQGPYDRNGPDGSPLLEIALDDIVDRYVIFARKYYEIELDRDAVAHVVAHRPLTDAIAQALNPAATVAELNADIEGIGYPTFN